MSFIFTLTIFVYLSHFDISKAFVETKYFNIEKALIRTFHTIFFASKEPLSICNARPQIQKVIYFFMLKNFFFFQNSPLQTNPSRSEKKSKAL